MTLAEDEPARGVVSEHPTHAGRRLYLAVPDDGSRVRGRLLLMTYHFPPSQAAGALRWEKLVRYARERGLLVDVLSLDPRDLSRVDESRLGELPPGTRVFGVATRPAVLSRIEKRLASLLGRWSRRTAGALRDDASSVARSRPESIGRDEIRWTLGSRRSFERAFHALVDYVQIGRWGRDAAALGRLLARRTRYAAVVTCGPPHMVHECGRELARDIGVPYVMDLRDPWSLWQRLPEYLASPLWLELARRYERRCIGQAGLVVTNTTAARDRMRAIYPDAANKIITAMNGFDEEELPAPAQTSRFVIAYAGTVYIDRDPRPLLAASARLISAHRLAPAEFGLEFMGDVSVFNGVTLEQLSREAGIAQYVTVHPPGRRREALEFLAGAHVLVVLPQDSELAIPSKLFEYTRYPAWILALARTGSAIETLLRGTSGDVAAPGDIDGLFSILQQRFEQFRRGELPRPLAAAQPELSRASQASVLFDALERVIRAGNEHSPDLASSTAAAVRA